MGRRRALLGRAATFSDFPPRSSRPAKFLPSIDLNQQARAGPWSNYGNAPRRPFMNPTSFDSQIHRALILFFRVAMGWTFLYAGVTQTFIEPHWTAASFLAGTKTFHAVYGPLVGSSLMPLIDFCVKWGHLLIGLSLVSGLMIRISGVFGILLMLVYWSAHLDFPYVSSPLNFLLDEHIVYAGIIVYLMTVRAGHVFGLDGLAEKFSAIDNNPFLRPLVR
jgi:thiosulfate dehydrogenase [quinone] large subunit